MSYSEKTVFPRALPFILSLFAPRTCTWRAVVGWIPTKMTSNGHFAYLSAGRSWLATFIWDRTTKKVSISPFFTCLARHPRPVMGIPVLIGQLILGTAPFGDRCPSLFGASLNVKALGATLSLLALVQTSLFLFMVLLATCYVG